MHTRLTMEGRAVRGKLVKLIGWVMVIVLGLEAVGMAGRTVVPAVSSWWNNAPPTPPPVMATAPRYVAPAQSTYQPPRTQQQYHPAPLVPVYIPPTEIHTESHRFELRFPWDKKHKEKDREEIKRESDAVTHHCAVSANP